MTNTNNKSGLERAGNWFSRILGMDTYPSPPSFVASKGMDYNHRGKDMDTGTFNHSKKQSRSFETLTGEVNWGGGLYPNKLNHQNIIYCPQPTEYRGCFNTIRNSLNSSPVVYLNQDFLQSKQYNQHSNAKELRYSQSCPSESSKPSDHQNLGGIDHLDMNHMTPQEKNLFLEEQKRQYQMFNQIHLQKQQNSLGKETLSRREGMDLESWVLVNYSNEMEQFSFGSSISLHHTPYGNNTREHSLAYSEKPEVSVYDSPNSMPLVWIQSNLNPNAQEWTGRNKKSLNPEAKEWVPINSVSKVSILDYIEDNNSLNRKKSVEDNVKVVDDVVDESVDEVDGCMPTADEKTNIISQGSSYDQSNENELQTIHDIPSTSSQPTLCTKSEVGSDNDKIRECKTPSSDSCQNEDQNSCKPVDECKSSSVSDCSFLDRSDSCSENDSDDDSEYDDDYEVDSDTDSDILFGDDSSTKHESDNDSDCDIVFGNDEDDCDDEIVNYLDNLPNCCSTVSSLKPSTPDEDKVSPCSFINVCDLSDEDSDEEDDDIDWECSSGPSKTCISASDWEFGLGLSKSNSLSCQSKMVTYIDKERKNSLSEADKANLRWETEIETDVKPNTGTRIRFSEDVTVEYVDADIDRVGEWEVYARNSMRFRNRVMNLACTLNPVLGSEHRNRIFEERFGKEE